MRARRILGTKLEFIDKDSATAIDECRDVGEALVIRTGQEKEPFWNDSAEVWIAAMTAAVAASTTRSPFSQYETGNDSSPRQCRTR